MSVGSGRDEIPEVLGGGRGGNREAKPINSSAHAPQPSSGFSMLPACSPGPRLLKNMRNQTVHMPDAAARDAEASGEGRISDGEAENEFSVTT